MMKTTTVSEAELSDALDAMADELCCPAAVLAEWIESLQGVDRSRWELDLGILRSTYTGRLEAGAPIPDNDDLLPIRGADGVHLWRFYTPGGWQE